MDVVDALGAVCLDNVGFCCFLVDCHDLNFFRCCGVKDDPSVVDAVVGVGHARILTLFHAL